MGNGSRRLRTLSDELLRKLDEIAALEAEKRELEVGSPRFDELAAEIERQSRDVLRLTQGQRAIGEASEGGGTIADTPRELPAILLDWREAERRAAAAPPGSPEAEAALRDAQRLREEYRGASQD